jgi:ELWxxDGT repeat protein
MPSTLSGRSLEKLESRTLFAAAHTASAFPSTPFEVGSHTFLVADDGTHGKELFTTGGTSTTTKLFKDLAPGTDSGAEYTFTIDNTLFAVGKNGLWKTDGTTATQVVKYATWMDSLIIGPQVGKERYFNVIYGDQRGLWKTDGTSAGTKLVQGYNYYIQFLGQVNGAVVYMANDLTANEFDRGDYHFFASGAAAGTATKLMDEVVSYSEGSRIAATLNSARVAKGNLYFSLSDPVDTDNITWWKTNGTAAGTSTVSGPPADILRDHNGTAAGDVGYFFEGSGAQTELWITDGTEDGTRLVKTVGVNPTGTAGGDDGSFYFFTEVKGKKQIWRSDGTSGGTKVVATLPAVTLSGPPILSSVVNGTLYYSPNDGVHGWELWKANTGGSQMVADINKTPVTVAAPSIFCAELVGKDDNVVDTNRPTFLVRDYGDETIGAIFVDGVEVVRKPTPAFAQMQVPNALSPGEHVVFAGIGGADGNLVALSPSITIVVAGDPTEPSAPPPPFITSGVLQIAGTADADVIKLYRRASNNKMLQVDVNGTISSFRLKGITRIQISTGDEADTITFDETNGIITAAAKVYAGAGNDTVTTGSGGDRVIGGAGDDWINAGAGNDAVYGEAGNDRLFGGAGNDYLVGGAGTNVLRGGAGTDRLVVAIGIDDYKGNKGDIVVKAT